MKYTEQHVEYACGQLQINHPNRDCYFYKFGLAVEALRILVGNEWVNQAIFPNDHPTTTPAVQSAIGFFRSKEGGYQYQERVYRLAARLYELQDVPNISRVTSSLATGDFEGAFAEIEAGRHLQSRSISFIYVLPQGQRGDDFDIQIQDEMQVNCEVKHKVEGTVLSKDTLERSFSAAKSQVPTNKPSILFIKVPAGWVQAPEMEGAIKTFFSSNPSPRSPNVVGIMLRWEEAVAGRDGIFLWKYRFKANPTFVDDSGGAANLVGKLLSAPNNSAELDKLLLKYVESCRS